MGVNVALEGLIGIIVLSNLDNLYLKLNSIPIWKINKRKLINTPRFGLQVGRNVISKSHLLKEKVTPTRPTQIPFKIHRY